MNEFQHPREWAIVVTHRDHQRGAMACTTVSGFATKELADAASRALAIDRPTESVTTVIVRVK
jgi:hypothetical protein